MSVITKYLPRAWQDEVNPEAQADVNTFIRDGGDQWVLCPAEHQITDSEAQYFVTPLTIGAVIAFEATRDFGDYTLTIHENGSYEVDDTYPDEANNFIADWNIYTLQDTLDGLVKRGGGELGEEPLPPGEHDLRVYWWANQPTYFRFIVEDSKPRFEPCAGPN